MTIQRWSFRRALMVAAAVALPASALGAEQLPTPAAPPAKFSVQDALDLSTYQIADLSEDGAWLVATSSVRRDSYLTDYHRDSDPTYLRPRPSMIWIIDTKSGTTKALFPDKRDAIAPRWSPDGSKLALLVRKGDAYEPTIWERATGRFTTVRAPAGKYVAENSDVRWTADGKSIVFALHTLDWKKKAQAQFEQQTAGPIFVQSSKDPFLAWDDMRRASNIRSVVAYDLLSAAVRQLLPEMMVASYEIAEDGTVVTYNEDVTKKTDYDVIFGSESKAMVVPAAGGAARVVFPTLKGIRLVWATDGQHYAYGKDGRIFVASVSDTTSRMLAGPAKDAKAKPDSTADTTKVARDAKEREKFTPISFSPKGDVLLASNKDGFWIVDAASGAKEMFLATPDTSLHGPTRNVIAWGADGRALYLSHASRTEWKRGILRYDRDSKALAELALDTRSYSGFRLSKNGKVAAVAIGDVYRPADLYVGDADLKTLRRVVHTNPQLDGKALGHAGLTSYLDADGHSKYAVIYYPPDYDQSKRYPTVFNVYEEFFNDAFDPVFNILNASGYVVVQPSVDFDIGYPGEAWVKGVTAAANKLIEAGVADSARLGVFGTSYGGYATNLLITQTSRFKAAINISGKVDVISFYTDSPRLGVRNIHAAEKSQDRLGATLWQQPQKYVQQSAIMFADRITTPLLLLTGAQDQNVPADNTREMFYALRRLGKEVVWVNYMNGGHGAGNASVADYIDYLGRLTGWFDSHLKGDAKKAVAATEQ
ncbi:MAG: prolyl oligopeptidase family serine peptidase [Gemmatimonadaceae bacterium]